MHNTTVEGIILETKMTNEKKETKVTTWYYYAGGQKHGPITGGQLKGLAKTGIITPETAVETEGGKTVPARKVKGLTFNEPAQKPVSCSPADVYVVPPSPTTGELYEVKPPEHDPFTAAIPETVESPFVAPPLVEELSADNPFTAALSVIPEPVVANPFSVPVPTVVEEPIKDIAENFSEQDFDQLIQDGLKSSARQKPFRVSDPSLLQPPPAYQTRPQNASLPAATDGSGSSWQVTIIGLAAILVVGWLGWTLISNFDGGSISPVGMWGNEDSILVLRDDGIGTWDMGDGDPLRIIWRVESGRLHISTLVGDVNISRVQNYRIAGSTMTLTDNKGGKTRYNRQSNSTTAQSHYIHVRDPEADRLLRENDESKRRGQEVDRLGDELRRIEEAMKRGTINPDEALRQIERIGRQLERL